MSDDYYTLVDFNGTLVEHEKGAKVVDDDGEVLIGKPIPRMVEKVRRLIDQGMEVRILCGTVGEGGEKGAKMEKAIRQWTKEHLGKELRPTGTVTTRCLMIWNDKAKEVVRNSGRFRHEGDGEEKRRSGVMGEVASRVMEELERRGVRAEAPDREQHRGLRRVYRAR